MKASEISPLEFQTAVRMHLTRVAENIPDVVPRDVFDASAQPMMKHLDELEDFLYGFGYEERRREEAEHKRQLHTAAKRENPQIEELAQQIDRRVQHAITVMGSSSPAVLTPMDADLCVSAFVQFLDAMPECAFAVDRIIPPDFPSARDITVSCIIAAMRIRKERQRNAR